MKRSAPALPKTLLTLCFVALLGIGGNAASQAANDGAGDDCPFGPPSTVACVRKYMITDAQLNSAVETNSLANHLEKIYKELGSDASPGSYAAAKKRLDGIRQYAADQSSEWAVPTPSMYVSMMPTQADQTREGQNFILVNKYVFRTAVLSDEGAEKLRLSLSREFARIRNGDTSPSAVANHHTNPAASREAGLRADLEGAGPMGARNPIAMTFAIEDELRSDLHKLVFFKGSDLDDIEANRISDRDYKRISDEHVRAYNDVFNVSPWDRIMALRKESRLMAEYEQTHAVRSPADRNAESKWLVAQILSDAIRGSH